MKEKNCFFGHVDVCFEKFEYSLISGHPKLHILIFVTLVVGCGLSFCSVTCLSLPPSSSYFGYLLTTSSGHLFNHFIRPNFTASYLQLVEQGGAFLESPNATFKASIYNPNEQLPEFYFSVIHSSSNTIIWTANRNRPVSQSAKLLLTLNGLLITDDLDRILWSTPNLNSSVAFIQLHDSGNLVLLDQGNISLWETFDYPTYTLLMGQRLPVDIDFSVVDAVLQWNGMTYWVLSMDNRAFKDSNSPVSFMALNVSGLYWMGDDAEDCRIPSICGKIGFCSSAICSCPPAFPNGIDGCVPINPSFTLPKACNESNGSETNHRDSYLKIGDNIDYFSTDFVEPLSRRVNLSYCQLLSSQNCSCLGSRFGATIYIKGFPINCPCCRIWWRRRKWHSRTAVVRLGSKNSSSAEIDTISIPGLPVRIEYEELATATDNFKTQIGSDGFGTVCKGILPNGPVVAVKKIRNLGVEGKDIWTEIAIIGDIHNVNRVKFKGFCVQGKQRFLVYEYMNRGSLDRAIFNDESVLEWKRFEIALGTARGLAYLHGGCQPKIIHCDIKPENTLLHDNLQVKISDFGISSLLTPEQSTLLTTLRGTRGYLAPEWLTSSGISEKSDVYSYGMLLLETVKGRRNFSTQIVSNSCSCAPSGLELERMYFPLLALEMHEQKRYLEVPADPRLEGSVKSEEVETLVRVASCCVEFEPTSRPTMSNVVGMLEGCPPLGRPRIVSQTFCDSMARRYAEALATYTDGSELILDHQPTASSRLTLHPFTTHLRSQIVF
ncbi:LOW QUALITY PROTEIN: G-type lectin S-receptor-like serine/threonine-protein kinase At5g35370 [Durio zibethinus]|uniref:Receptor-like serine/threonine-protein kinase n=1 Tax=Durio zibethinus TaxID=66656 RepID=A0A6P5XLL9_DURZI|nr:LOW QUALITY PROTEIN: G-type lectin S-receptor-like serine/threonine-protein kinase At5g35370 [Durio zibethinus]